VTERDATEALERAIYAAAEAGGHLEDGETITHWVVVAASVSMAEDNGKTGYVMFSTGGTLPAHVVAGLCDMGRHVALNAPEE